MQIVITSGYFNPLHVGHLDYLTHAKKLGDKHICIVNSDYQVKLKGSVPFMNEEDRTKIISSLKCVDEVLVSLDKDKTQCETIKSIASKYPKDNLMFCNGGDRVADNIPETEVCNNLNIQLVFEVGGSSKRASSSEILKKIKKQKH